MKKILVIDDHIDIRNMIRRRLKILDFEVLDTESGKIGIDMLSQDQSIDLVLVDQSMPEMDGLSFMGVIKAQLEAPPPCIMITAHGSTELAVEFMRLGGTDFIEKPIDFNILHVRIIAALKHAEIEQRLYQYKVEHHAEQAAHEYKNVFLALMAHKINTPIHSIQNFSNFIAKNLQQDQLNVEKIATHIEIIRKSVRKLKDEVSYVIRSTLLDQNTALDISTINLAQLQQELVAYVTTLNCQHVSIKPLLTEQKIPDFMADHMGLTEVIHELIENAIKFSTAGEVTLTAKFIDGQVQLIIKDSGIGIAAEDQQKIFRIFTTLDESNETSGVGVGLYLCQKIVDQMQGTIKLSSELGKGTEVTLSFPVA